jgi:hypothetical protein
MKPETETAITMQTMDRPATMAGLDNHTYVAKYGSHTDAEAAVRELEKSGFEMKALSIVGVDYQTEEHVVGYYNVGDRMKAWGKQGAFWGGLWGLLFGSAFFIIPGIGPILVAGPLAAAIVGALEGAAVVGGMSALGAALAGLGVPKDTVLAYETELKAGKFLLIAHGLQPEIARAKAILEASGHEGMCPNPG